MKYQITITEKEEYTAADGKPYVRDIPVYSQQSDDLDIPAVIAVINKLDKKPELAKK